MPDRIFLPPGVTDAIVVLVGDECYERVGSSEQSPTISAIDGEYDSCNDCEGSSSSSGSSASADPCTDCDGDQPSAGISNFSCTPACDTSPDSSVEYYSFTNYGAYCGWLWISSSNLTSIELYYFPASDTWSIYVDVFDGFTIGLYWQEENSTLGLSCSDGHIAGTADVPFHTGACAPTVSRTCDSLTVTFG